MASRGVSPLCISALDGVHPNVFGHVVLAAEAARAMNAQYGQHFASAASPAVSFQADDNNAAEILSAPHALELARTVARDHRGMQLPSCFMPGDCRVGTLRLR